jgi:hypothetical protein
MAEKVVLISSDSERFEVEKRIACMSLLVSGMVNDEGGAYKARRRCDALFAESMHQLARNCAALPHFRPDLCCLMWYTLVGTGNGEPGGQAR